MHDFFHLFIKVVGKLSKSAFFRLENCKNSPFFGWKIVKKRRFSVGKLQKHG